MFCTQLILELFLILGLNGLTSRGLGKSLRDNTRQGSTLQESNIKILKNDKEADAPI